MCAFSSLGAKFKASSGKTVAPLQSFFLPVAAEHPVLVLLGGDVPLPLALAVAVPAAQLAVEGVLEQRGRFPVNGRRLRVSSRFQEKTRGYRPVARGNQWAS